jgi:hypothetical protein
VEKMKQIICFVNADEKEILNKQVSPVTKIYFAENSDEFNSKLTADSMQIISLNIINQENYKSIANIIKSHPDINFFVLDKEHRTVEIYEFDILTCENILASPYSLSEIIELC